MSDFSNTGDHVDDAGQGTSFDQQSGDPSPASSPGLISSASAPGGSRVSQVWAESKDNVDTAAGVIEEPPKTTTVELTAAESRVLGALIEKSYLTPDIYPMTTNALVTASNQKTNRDPVVDYSAVLIDSTLMELRQRNLVRRVHSPGSRSTKHRQTLDEALSLSPRELALVSVLLLRGPQTIGELRLRTERHDVGFDDLDAVESCLEALASRGTPLVKQLARQPGHKENRWQHLLGGPETFGDEAIVEHLAAPVPATQSAERAPAPAAAAADAGVATRIAELEAQVATLTRQLATLADKLGEPLD